MLSMFKFLELIVGGFDCCSLMADDILQGADEFPHHSARDPTRRILWCKGIATSSSLPILTQQAGSAGDRSSFVIVPRDVGHVSLGVCGMGLGPSRRWVRHRSVVSSRSVHIVAGLWQSQMLSHCLQQHMDQQARMRECHTGHC